jgi:hypothetical protein
MSAEFDVSVVNRNGWAIVFMRGEIDLTAGEQIHAALTMGQPGCADVYGRFHVVGATGAVRRVFEITGVDHYLLDGDTAIRPDMADW